MAEPIKLEHDISEKKIDESKNKLFDIGDNLLLPVMLIFILSKSDIDIPILGNLKKATQEVISLPQNIDLSPEDIGTMINVVDTAAPYMNPENQDMIDNFSAFLSVMQKFSAIKEYGNDMARNSSDGSSGPLEFQNQRQKALHMLGALEQYMDESTKKNMDGFKNTLNIIDKFQNTTSSLNEKRKSGGNIDIRDMIQLIGPLLGSFSNSPDVQQIDSMIRMVQIMSALNNEDGDLPISSGGEPEEDDAGAFFEFVIDRYDDEDEE